MDSGDDDRLAVVLGGDGNAQPGDLVLQLPPAAAGHALGCACCNGRDPLASALAAAFIARARGTGPWFARVVVAGGADDAARIGRLLAADPVMRARFRLA